MTSMIQFRIAEREHSLEEIEIRYQTERKEKELEKLSVVNELQEAKTRQFQILFWTSFSIFTLIIIIIIFYLRSRSARSNNLSLELEQRALRAQMNPHFIFNSLNSIQRLYVEGEFDKAADYMADFFKSSSLYFGKQFKRYNPFERRTQVS